MTRRLPSRRQFLTGLGTASAASIAGCSDEGPRRPLGYEPLGSVSIDGTAEAVVGADGETVYVAVGDGFATVDITDPASPEVLAERRGLLSGHADGPMEGIQDVAVDGDRALVVGPAHPRDTVPEAAVLFDVADPSDPRQLAVHETEFPIHNADVKDGFAYLTGTDGDRNPLVVVDMTGSPVEVARWSVLDVDTGWWRVDSGLWPIHDVRVTDQRAAVAYWDAGTWVLDVSDPRAPAPVWHVADQSIQALASLSGEAVEDAALELPGNSHFALLHPEEALLGVGREAWDADDDGDGAPGGIDLYDVTSPADPIRLATIDPPSTPDASLDGPWTTAHNFGFRDHRLYASWYRGGVSMHDLSDPESPTTLARWRQPRTTAFWTAVPAAGCFVGASTPMLTGTRGAVFTFPDEPGRQRDPPPIEVPSTTTPDA